MAGNTPLVVQPMVVGAMVDRLGLSERQAGILASVELAAVTLGILALVGIMSRVSRAQLGVFAVAAIVLANVVTCFVGTFVWLLPLRILSGVGAAAAFCVYLNMASSRAQPESVFAVVNAISIAYSGVLTLVTPAILNLGGLAGIMLTLSFMTLLALATIPWMQLPQSERSAARVVGLPPAGVAPLLAMMLLLYTGHGAIWAYQERIGAAAGLTAQSVGRALGLSMLVWGVLGSLLARLLGMTIGRVYPQLLSLGASCLAVILLVFASTPLSFAAASALIAFSWFYGLPYQMGLLAARDPQGRVALAGVMMSTGGMALGPGIAATFLVGYGHAPIGMFAGMCYLCALAIAVPAASGTRQMASGQLAP